MLKKVNLLTLLILPVILALGTIMFLLNTSRMELFPSTLIKGATSYYDGLSTEMGKGNSTVEEFKEDSSEVFIRYIVRDQIQYPYAGFYLALADSLKTLDISDFDEIEIIFSKSTATNMVVMLRTFIDGISKWNSRYTYRYLLKEIELSGARDTVTVPLSSFVTPLWWYEEFNIKESDVGIPTLKKFVEIKFESSELLSINKEQCFAVNSIVFIKNRKLQIVSILISLLIFYLVFGLLYLYFNKEEPKLIITYNKVDLSSHLDEETLKVVTYIAENYKNTTLTLGIITESTGIPGNRITTALKKSYNTSFKQYLNSIRLEEAKRLLRETDRQINEIYWRVGYSSKTHFYRVFKEYLKMSPQEYRKQDTIKDS